MSYEPEAYAEEPNRAAGRTTAPGIFLIVVGILNLLVGLGMLAMVPVSMSMPREQLQQLIDQQSPEAKKAFEQQNIGPEKLRSYYVRGFSVAGAVGVAVGLIVLFGGIRMLSFRSYGLAVLAAILALIPCISPTACCLLGEVAGIWALVVLMNQDVKSAFR